MKALTFACFLTLIPSLAFGEPDGPSPRLLVHLLDYLAKDYGGAVADGKVIEESEYREQVEFSGSALQAAAQLDAMSRNPGVQAGLMHLNELILAKADAETVSRTARAIQGQVIAVSGLDVAPHAWPNLSRGERLFAENCTSCHGRMGHGDGVLAATLKPPPSNFHDAEGMLGVSPFQAFNTIRLGVAGTAMPAFHSLSDSEAWDLAFYLVSLRHRGQAEMPAKDVGPLLASSSALRDAATLSDLELQRVLPGAAAATITALRLVSADASPANSLALARSILDEAVRDFQAGKYEAARTKAVKAYLEGVEPIEPRLRAVDGAAVVELEAQMASFRSALGSRDVHAVTAAAESAKAKLASAETLLSGRQLSPWVTFLSAAGVILREGFEAVLIILTLLGVIRATGSRRAALWVHSGWILALASGGMAWILSGWLLQLSGAGREMMEGVTSLFAVVVLLFVGFWLHRQAEISRWKSALETRVKAALEGNNVFGLAAISFIAVFREVFESVLFLRAISLEGGSEGTTAMTAGVVLSLAIVIGLTWALLRYSVRIPIRKLFAFSAMLMAGLATILAGKGLHALQESGALSVTASPLAVRWDLLGLYPTLETLTFQLAVVAVGVGLWHYGKRPANRLSAAAD